MEAASLAKREYRGGGGSDGEDHTPTLVPWRQSMEEIFGIHRRYYEEAIPRPARSCPTAVLSHHLTPSTVLFARLPGRPLLPQWSHRVSRSKPPPPFIKRASPCSKCPTLQPPELTAKRKPRGQGVVRQKRAGGKQKAVFVSGKGGGGGGEMSEGPGGGG